jgi:DNA-binding NarL/FixJ family response regulator
MPSALIQKPTPLDKILVIDDLPLIPLAFQEVFRAINKSAKVEYSENIFSALSARIYANAVFDLVITGSLQDNFSEQLQQAVTELKKKFGNPRIMLYSSAYDPVIIEKMAATGIDAYVHKYESIEEIRKAYIHLGKGESYVSEIFHTLYYEYGQGVRK